MRPRITQTLIAGLISALAALLAMSVLAAGASAETPLQKQVNAVIKHEPNPGPPLTTVTDGPQTANVPYVAWVGEHVRLVACDPEITPANVSRVQFSNWSTEDWSGYQFQPPSPDGFIGNNLFEVFDPGPSAFFPSSVPAHARDGCVATIYKSLNPGLARIKVDVRDYLDPGKTVFSYQFLVIWLTANKPVLNEATLAGGGSEVFQRQLNASGKAALSSFLGDKEVTGKFVPSPFDPLTSGEGSGLVQVKVSGNFPVKEGSPLREILKKPEYTLPTDWPELAETLSSSVETTDETGDNPRLWDIHGTPSQNSEGEERFGEGEEVLLGVTTANECEHATGGHKFSPTDNCNGGKDAFSRVFGDLTNKEALTPGTVGPYDPQVANQTLLSDGRLNAYDAPMPSMRIDVSIAPSNHTLGGVGLIQEVKKTKIYSHNFNGDEESSPSANNLYNPYYATYLPSTDRPATNESSGIAGPDHGSDFPGFLNGHPGPYNFWENAPSFTSENSSREEEKTLCIRRLPDEEYASPSGHLTETFYTDENGEAYVTYEPGDAFYLNRLHKIVNPGETEGVEKNADGGCDLRGEFEKVIGESLISAKAIYPYEPVDFPSVPSENTLKKEVVSKWQKEWYVFPKAVDLGSARIIVAKAQDIDGRPIRNEKVCFAYGTFSGIQPYYGEPTTHTLPDPKETVFGPGSGVKVLNLEAEGSASFEPGNQLCLHTNAEGLVAVVIENGSFSGVDLAVDFTEEGIIRDHEIEDPPAASGGAGSGPVTKEGAGNTTTTGSTTPLAATVSAMAATITAPFTAAKPLTPSQTLHKALNTCKKRYANNKKKKVACQAQARKAYQAQLNKASKKKQ